MSSEGTPNLVRNKISKQILQHNSGSVIIVINREQKYCGVGESLSGIGSWTGSERMSRSFPGEKEEEDVLDTYSDMKRGSKLQIKTTAITLMCSHVKVKSWKGS